MTRGLTTGAARSRVPAHRARTRPSPWVAGPRRPRYGAVHRVPLSDERSIRMRRRRIWIISVGFLVALGCLSLQWSRAPQARDFLRCSLTTLQGTYIYAYE